MSRYITAALLLAMTGISATSSAANQVVTTCWTEIPYTDIVSGRSFVDREPVYADSRVPADLESSAVRNCRGMGEFLRP